MNNLLIDIGNSAIKIGTGNPGSSRIKLLNRSSYDKNNFETDFRRTFMDSKLNISPDKIGICALKDTDPKYLNFFFEKNFGKKPIFINRNLSLAFEINYSDGLGNDRICSAAGAVSLHKNRNNILIIDFGTAITYTMLSHRVLIGGMISPGIMTSLKSLVEKTTLPDVKLSFPKKLINNNTADNIRAGVLFQSLFSAERFITGSKKKYKNLYVIATGGYSKLMKSKTKLFDETDSNLVLKGINIIISG